MELHSAIMPLCILSCLSGCVYIHIDKNTGEIRPLCWIRKSYNLLVITFLVIFSLWSLYWKFNLIHNSSIKILGILSILSEMALLIGLIIQSIMIALHLNYLKKITINMRQVEAILNLNTKQHYGYIRRFLLVLIILLFVLGLSVGTFNTFFWSCQEYRFEIAKFYICENILRFRITIHCLELFVFLLLIKERFILVNASLPTVIEMQTGYNEKCLTNATIKIKCNLHKLVPSGKLLQIIDCTKCSVINSRKLYQ